MLVKKVTYNSSVCKILVSMIGTLDLILKVIIYEYHGHFEKILCNGLRVAKTKARGPLHLRVCV